MKVSQTSHPLYRPISSHYREQFGTKARVLPVTLASTCPNRLGLKGMQTCVFCDEWGSAAYEEQVGETIADQIQEKSQLLRERYASEKILIYFQAYTNTFLSVEQLRRSFETAIRNTEVAGIIFGTRPDCLSNAVYELINEYAQKTYLSIELGVQSFEEHQLEFMRRGHSGEQSIAAIQTLSEKTSVPIGIHLIFGNPNETDLEIIRAAERCNQLPIHHVKLHHLHVLKNTPLEEMYHEGSFQPVDLKEYARRVGVFLSHLDPKLYVQRLAAVSSRWDQLVAPEWTRDKKRSFQFILDSLKAEKHYQGAQYSA